MVTPMMSAAAIWDALDSDERFSAWWRRAYPDTPQPVYPRDAPISYGQGGGRFTFYEHGESAAILPVMDIYGQIYDLVAWHPARPAQWWLHEGVGRALGEDAIDKARLWSRPLTVPANPHEWVIGGGVGCCPLRGYEVLMGVGSVQCSPAIHKAIERDIRAAYPVPVLTP